METLLKALAYILGAIWSSIVYKGREAPDGGGGAREEMGSRPVWIEREGTKGRRRRQSTRVRERTRRRKNTEEIMLSMGTLF
jgi:hypothetical protein